MTKLCHQAQFFPGSWSRLLDDFVISALAFARSAAKSASLVASAFPEASAVLRPVILALSVCSGTTALCQSAASAPLVVTPAPARDFSKLPQGWHMDNVKPLPTPRILVQPKVVTTRRLGDAQIDPNMIVHPPATSIGVLPPGTQIAQNQYDHLQLQPIESTRSTPAMKHK
jgi:hypothetical protein